MPYTGWMENARCLDADPDIFFLDVGKPTTEAEKVCESCSVQKECLEYELLFEDSDRDAFGIWGGTSPRERRRLRKLSKV